MCDRWRTRREGKKEQSQSEGVSIVSGDTSIIAACCHLIKLLEPEELIEVKDLLVTTMREKGLDLELVEAPKSATSVMPATANEATKKLAQVIAQGSEPRQLHRQQQQIQTLQQQMMFVHQQKLQMQHAGAPMPWGVQEGGAKGQQHAIPGVQSVSQQLHVRQEHEQVQMFQQLQQHWNMPQETKQAMIQQLWQKQAQEAAYLTQQLQLLLQAPPKATNDVAPIALKDMSSGKRCLPEGNACMKDMHNWKEALCPNVKVVPEKGKKAQRKRTRDLHYNLDPLVPASTRSALEEKGSLPSGRTFLQLAEDTVEHLRNLKAGRHTAEQNRGGPSPDLARPVVIGCTSTGKGGWRTEGKSKSFEKEMLDVIAMGMLSSTQLLLIEVDKPRLTVMRISEGLRAFFRHLPRLNAIVGESICDYVELSSANLLRAVVQEQSEAGGGGGGGGGGQEKLQYEYASRSTFDITLRTWPAPGLVLSRGFSVQRLALQGSDTELWILSLTTSD
jgi:hypothetical protein